MKTENRQRFTAIRRLLIVVLFSIAFAYIESAVMVYLRVIFDPDGFSFPLAAFDLNPLWRRLILTEAKGLWMPMWAQFP